ncbi:hypothetical protein J4221_03420 [Candidatus Pacearchaeota archaeon]|nr:hypothetical protein [Candidatus Pacearchaeota archaeon]
MGIPITGGSIEELTKIRKQEQKLPTEYGIWLAVTEQQAAERYNLPNEVNIDFPELWKQSEQIKGDIHSTIKRYIAFDRAINKDDPEEQKRKEWREYWKRPPGFAKLEYDTAYGLIARYLHGKPAEEIVDWLVEAKNRCENSKEGKYTYADFFHVFFTCYEPSIARETALNLGLKVNDFELSLKALREPWDYNKSIYPEDVKGEKADEIRKKAVEYYVSQNLPRLALYYETDEKMAKRLILRDIVLDKKRGDYIEAAKGLMSRGESFFKGCEEKARSILREAVKRGYDGYGVTQGGVAAEMLGDTKSAIELYSKSGAFMDALEIASESGDEEALPRIAEYIARRSVTSFIKKYRESDRSPNYWNPKEKSSEYFLGKLEKLADNLEVRK